MTISECVRSSPWWGVVKSLGHYRRGPVGLVHTQKIEAQSEKPTWTKALEFTQFACSCGTDPRLLSGEQRTSHFKLVTSVDDPGCVKTCTSQESAELFSLSSSLSSGRKHFWFSNLRNRDGISTRRLNVGVFTQPRSKADLTTLKWDFRSSPN